MTPRDVADKEPDQGNDLRHSTDQCEGRADQHHGAVQRCSQSDSVAKREPQPFFGAQVLQMVHWTPQE